MVAELARGGMGIVHLAQTRGPGGFEKLVVVKELKHELRGDAVYTQMFLDEARLAARLSHRHIVQTNEVGCEGGRYFMALELLEGGSLAQVRVKLGLSAMPVNVGLRVVAAVLDALDHAHDLTDSDGRALDVVHRDVSPHNVFLTFDGDVKLIDFGVAKSSDRRGQTKVGVVKGSVPYMSPDHVDGSTIDRRADVFAVGVILREMLVGERLWGDADDLTILRSLIAREIPALPAALELPAPLRAIVQRALAPNRSIRFPTAAAMRDELEAYLAEVDPRGSLDDLGTWLGATLSAERTAFRELVRRSRAATSATVPAATKAHVWLPSCNLDTRYSGPPVLPLAPPPLPAAAKHPVGYHEARQRRSRSLRFFSAGAVFAAALALAAFGLSQPRNVDPAAFVDRAPREVHDPITVSVNTTLSAADDPDPELAAASSAVAEAASQVVEPSASRVPASVLREPLPPNPYDPEW